MKKTERARGFTLIEILVVIGLIAVLAGVVLVAINPARQFAQGRNTQRFSNVNAIINAIGQDLADNKGVFSGVCDSAVITTPMSTTTIKNSSGNTAGEIGCLVPTYIPAIPTDPTASSGSDTGYTLSVSSIGRIMVCAPAANEAALGNPGAICVVR